MKRAGQRIRVAQLGIGHNHGAAKMATLRRMSDLFEVVGVCEPDEEWRRKRGNLDAYAGLPFLSERALLDRGDIEAVAVETDVPELVPAARRCIEAGKHLHLDKPGGESLDPFTALLEEAERRNLTVQMGYMYRHNPAFQFCLDAVRKGWLGRIFEIHGVMSRRDGEDYRRWLARFHGGAMYIFGGHLIDPIVSLLGRPDRVLSCLCRTWPERDALADNGLAVLAYPGATATVRTSVVEIEGIGRRQFTVCGDEGTIEIRPLDPDWKNPAPLALRLVLARGQGAFQAGVHDLALPVPAGRYDEQLREWAGLIRGERENPWSFAHEITVQETLLRACGVEADAAEGDATP